jgi:uncharacterized repeat protein (TIGR03803 family)
MQFVRSSQARFAVLALLGVLCIVPYERVLAQTLTVLHNFTGGSDGGNPVAGLTLDRGGNLYGTNTSGGGRQGFGVAFEMKNYGVSWILTPIHVFTFSEGITPQSRLVFGPDGGLYGTTQYGGGNGTLFKLRPPITFCRSISCPWSVTVLHTFGSGMDASQPNDGDLVFDSSGNIYGVTGNGGLYDQGAVYELMKTGNTWTEQVLYSFAENSGGANPIGGVVFDRAGNLYGTNIAAGNGNGGVVYQLVRSGQTWTENVLHSFTGGVDGERPTATLTADRAGNLYGPTQLDGIGDGGTIFELTDTLMFNTIYSFSSQSQPFGALAIDATGSLYGTTLAGGNMQGMCAPYGCGTIFKLVPTNGGWEYVDLHDFTGTDGWDPTGAVILDANGNLYGTTAIGGATNYGVVWKLTQ